MDNDTLWNLATLVNTLQSKSFFGKDNKVPDPFFSGQFTNISDNILINHGHSQETIGYYFAGVNLLCTIVFLTYKERLHYIVPHNITKQLFGWSIFLRFFSGFLLNSSHIVYSTTLHVENLNCFNLTQGVFEYWTGRAIIAVGRGCGVTSVILHVAITHILYKRGKSGSHPCLFLSHLIVLLCILLSSTVWFILAHCVVAYYATLFLIWFFIAAFAGSVWDVYSKRSDYTDTPASIAYTRRIYAVGLVNMFNIALGAFCGILGVICWELTADNPAIILLSLSILYMIYRPIWRGLLKFYKSSRVYFFPMKKTRVISLQQSKPKCDAFFIHVNLSQNDGRSAPQFDRLSHNEEREVLQVEDIFSECLPPALPLRADVYKTNC